MSRATWAALLLATSAACATVQSSPSTTMSSSSSSQSSSSSPSSSSPPPPRYDTRTASAVNPANLFADMGMGFGRYRHDTKGDDGVASGGTEAVYTRLRAEYVSDAKIGGGFSSEFATSDDDLFGDSSPGDTSGSDVDFFMFFVADPDRSEQFRFPIRVGPYIHTMSLNDDVTDTDVHWTGVGLRAEIEPEWWFFRRRQIALGLVGDFSGGVHATRIDLDPPGDDDHFDGNGYTLGAEAGFQALFARHFSARLSYLYRTTHEDESDPENGIRVREALSEFNGVVMELGVRF